MSIMVLLDAVNKRTETTKARGRNRRAFGDLVRLVPVHDHSGDLVRLVPVHDQSFFGGLIRLVPVHDQIFVPVHDQITK